MKLTVHVDGHPNLQIIAAPISVEPLAHDELGTIWRAKFHHHAFPLPHEIVDGVTARSGGAFPLFWEAVQIGVDVESVVPTTYIDFIEGDAAAEAA